MAREWITLIYCLIDWCTCISSKKRLSCICDELSIQKYPSWNIFYLWQYETLPIQTSHSSLPNIAPVQSASIFRGLSHTFTSSNKLQCNLHYKWAVTKATLISVHTPSNKERELQRLDFYKPSSGQVTCPPLSDCHKILQHNCSKQIRTKYKCT